MPFQGFKYVAMYSQMLGNSCTHKCVHSPNGMQKGVQGEAELPHRVNQVLDVQHLVCCDLEGEHPAGEGGQGKDAMKEEMISIHFAGTFTIHSTA